MRLFVRPFRLLALLLAMVPPVIPRAAEAAGPACPAPMPGFRLHLPHARAAVHKDGRLLVIALGSSSTEGSQASSPGHAYPAVLGRALAHGLPGVRVEVRNKGIGGQDVVEMLARMRTDVLAARPDVVVWQVGANGALRDADPAEFARKIGEGVALMKDAGIDVVLMDNQRAPQIQRHFRRLAIEGALSAQARAQGVGLFSRGALMDMWAEAGHPNTEFLAADGLHHNDRGYACVAEALAGVILSDVAPRVSAARP